MQQEKYSDLLVIVILLWAIIFLPAPGAARINKTTGLNKNSTRLKSTAILYNSDLYLESCVIPGGILKF